MDEIGLMVTKIDDKGFLHVTQIGGFDQRTLPAQEVWVHGKKTLMGFVELRNLRHFTQPVRTQKDRSFV
jgi:endoglucanase